MYNLIITAILVVAFFMCVSSFLFGMRVQKTISNGNIPNVTINPVKRVIEAVEKHEAKKESKEESEELENVMEYSRETALREIKKAVG